MSSVPGTPKTPRTPRVSKKTASTPAKTILNYDTNNTYIEEEDETFLYQSSVVSDISDTSESDTTNSEYPEKVNLVNILDEDDEKDTSTEATTVTEKELEQESDETTESDIKPSGTDKVLDPASVFAELSGFRKFLVKHEVPRKVLHSSIGVFTLWLYTLGVHQSQLIVPLSTLFAGIFTNDYVRFRNPKYNNYVVNTFWFLIREQEINRYNGVLWYLAGLIIVFSIFPKDISLMSVLLLSWSDTAASTIGRRFGKYTPKISAGKSVAGSLASFVTGVFSCYLLYGYFIPNFDVNVPSDILWTASTSKVGFATYALLSGVIASVSEFIDLWGIDDNFTIPVLSAFFLYGVLKVLEL